jgi:aspartyl-tRNA(Asn)/glutamyl-tRNA(Gln) amidotransferase subunit C
MAAPKIDRELVVHVAKLACLSLTDAEAARFAGELARIMDYVQELNTLDTADVPPTAHVQIDWMPLRSDEPAPCVAREEALSQAPHVEADGFAVPAFVE